MVCAVGVEKCVGRCICGLVRLIEHEGARRWRPRGDGGDDCGEASNQAMVRLYSGLSGYLSLGRQI
jgi:hypothetical protein